MARRSTLTSSIELALAAPAVIAMRSARMLSAGAKPGAADRREMSRMVNEKIGAFAESWFAMAASQQRTQVDAWLAFVQAWWAPWLRPRAPLDARARRAFGRRMRRSHEDWLASGLAPLHRVATANVRRLSRARLR